MSTTLSRSSLLKTIFAAGITGAILIDFYLVVTEVWIMHRATTLVLFQWDASNILGAAAFRGGAGVAVFGCLLHLIVSLIWAAIFTLATIRLPAISRHAMISGLLFGVIVKLVMVYIVVPLGAAQLPPRMPLLYVANNYAAHILFFGVPVAFVVSRSAAISPRAA